MDKDKLRASLELHEGRRVYPYIDSVGKISFGIGRNLKDKAWRPDELELVNELIELCYRNDVSEAAGYAVRYPWYNNLSDVRQNVVVELIFNMGPARFAGFQRFQAAMAQGRWADAAKELDDSKWQEQVDPVVGDGKGRADDLMRDVVNG